MAEVLRNRFSPSECHGRLRKISTKIFIKVNVAEVLRKVSLEVFS